MAERLPKSAMAYITLIAFLAIGAFADACSKNPLAIKQFALLPVLILIGIYSGSLKVLLFSNQNSRNSATISLGFIATIISLLVYGPVFGMVVGVSTMANFKIQNAKKIDIQKQIFNISSIVLTCWLTSHVTNIAQLYGVKSVNVLIDDPRLSIFANDTSTYIWKSLLLSVVFIISVLGHHIASCLFLTVAISLHMGWDIKKAKSFFINNTLWVIPTYLVAGCFIIMSVWIINNLYAHFYRVIPLCLVIMPQPLLYLHNLRLHRERDEERERRFQELESLYSSMVQAMGRAIEAKDRYTQEHIARVVAMSMAIGRHLDLPEDKLRALEVGAALHDIGKIAIPEAVLNKPGKLTPEEFELIKEHSALGSEILEPVPFPPEVVEAVRHHHEKWDGSGYPDKLVGNQIPMMARIVAVADVYDALTSDRPYRAAWSHQRAMEFMSSQVGTHFNPEIFWAFEQAMREHPELCSQASDPPAPTLRLAA